MVSGVVVVWPDGEVWCDGVQGVTSMVWQGGDGSARLWGLGDIVDHDEA